MAAAIRRRGNGGPLFPPIQTLGEDEQPFDNSLEVPANVLVIFGNVLGMLFAASELLTASADLQVFGMLGFQLAAIVVTGVLTQCHSWRLALRATAFGTVAMAALVLNGVITVHWTHRVEVASLLIGTTLLAIGHLAWYREGDNEDESATASLWLGSFLTAIPLAIGLVFYRSFEVETNWNWMLFHEITAVAISLIMVGSGIACRIRSTTIMGVGLLAAYVMSLVTLVQWPSQLQSVSVVMMVGGGLFFIVAVLLSVYRDRIVQLPEHIRSARGLFRVLRWR